MSYNTFFITAIFLFLVLLGAMSLGYSEKARFFPGIFIIPAMVLLVVELLREISAKRKTSGDKAEAASKMKETPGPKRSPFRYLSAAAWIVGLLVMIYLFGYLISAPLFVFLYTKLHGERWLLAINLSLAVAAVVYVGFILALGRPLHEGLLFIRFL